MAKKKNQYELEWEEIASGKGQKYLQGGTVGTKEGSTTISNLNALREEARRKQQEEINNRSVDTWKQLRDEADLDLKSTQNALQQKLNENNINARVQGKSVINNVNYKNDLQVGEVPKFNYNALQENQDNTTAMKQYLQTQEAKDIETELNEKWNTRAEYISGYETKKAIEDEKKLGILSKLALSPVQGAASMFSWTRGDLTTDEGMLPSYNETMIQQTRENAENPLLRVGYGALGEIGKQGVVRVLNQVIPGAHLGTIAYFGDIANDQYNNAIRRGYSEDAARNYALLSTGAEALFERFLGSGSSYFGGKMGAESVVSGVLKKFIKNETVNNLLSGMISEGTEEFLEEYLGEFNEQLTLNWADKGEDIDWDKFKSKEMFNQALESGMIGAITGAYGGGMQQIYTPKDVRNVNQAIYTIERQTGTKLSDANINTINTMQYIGEEMGRPLSAKELVDNYNTIKQTQMNNFKNSALDMFPNLDETSRERYNNLINDVSQLINDTGVSIKFDPTLDTVSQYDGSTLKINPTLTNMPIKTLILKELGTDILDNKTKSDIIKGLKKNGVYDALKQELLDSGEFDEANVDNEIVSRELNDLLVNQDKLNQLAKENKSAITKLKDVINNLTAKLGNRTTKDATYLRQAADTMNKVNLQEDVKTKELKQIEKQTNKEVKEKVQNQVSEIEQPKNNKSMNPLEIAKLKPSDANTTPDLEKRTYNKKGNGKSKQVETLNKSQIFTEEQKNKIIQDEEFAKYDKITNKESLNQAFNKLEKGGVDETLRWMNSKNKVSDATDIAEGIILMKQYADNGNLDSMVEVAKKLREMKTITAQALQASSIMSRMTPEGMVAYAQSELTEAYNKMIKNKTKEWINNHRSEFELSTSDVEFIMDTMKKVSQMEDGYDKKVELAKIQKLMTDKIPPDATKSIKGWMRLAMLFNPKTQVRNVVGNALITPVNAGGDVVASWVDKQIAKKTGVRTTGNPNVRSYIEGAKQGAYEATNDFKLGINTKDMSGNRFEIGEGKSFTEKTIIGKGLNRTEGILNYMMDVGDRVFSQAAFENSLANQMKLNNVDTPTQDMIDIATTESLQRTWNDNNNYTKFVLDVRRMLNRLGGENYGLGDVLIPFAKTPANLTKAIVDYSPAGLVNALLQYNNMNKAISRGDFTPQQQHKFVQTLGKATAGSMLYILGAALASAGVITGKDDEDKDTKNFIKNVLGTNQYSIKIGNKSFTYDWAQPIAAPFSIMANVMTRKNNKGSALFESILSSLDTAGSILLEQSFLQSINDVLSDNNGIVSGLINEIMQLPARAVPTFSKQVADMVDGTQRQTYEYNKPVKTALNSILVKIPFASKTLAPKVDTMGADVLKYGGKNNIFNVMFNPANVNKENVSKAGQEIYDVYKATGDSSIMPRVAPYYINKNGEKTILNSKQIAEYQKISGSVIEKSIDEIMNDPKYKNASESEKASIIKNIVDYSYNYARDKVLGIEMPSTYNKANQFVNGGGNVGDYYLNSKEINYSLENPERYKVISQITDYDSYNKYSNDITELRKNTTNDKEETINYIDSLDLSLPQKAMMIRLYYKTFDTYNTEIINYIDENVPNYDDKVEILKKLNFDVDDDGNVRW